MSEGGGKAGDDMSISDLLGARHLRKQLLVGVIIKIGVQFSGIDAIFYYSTLMFRHANVADPQVSSSAPFTFVIPFQSILPIIPDPHLI